MTKDDVDSARRMKAYILPEADKLCMVLKGEFLEHVTKTERQKHPGLTYLLIGEEYWDDPEDAALREAWERLKRDTRLHTARFYPPDGYYIARGPGVVECSECPDDHGRWDNCHLCNPTGEPHPTLIPLDKAGLEELPAATRFVQKGELTWDDVLLGLSNSNHALIVVREEECLKCKGSGCVDALAGLADGPDAADCSCGTGKVEHVEVHSRGD